MKSNYFSQVLYEMKHQPVIGVVTVIGTALAIFLIMIVVMMHLVTVIPSMSYGIAKRLFGDLKYAETVSYFTEPETTDICVVGSAPSIRYQKTVDSEFWKIFNYEFTHGRPFTEDEIDACMRVAIVSESVAREMYGTTDACGREILVAQVPYRIVGVVKDSSPLATTAFSDIFTPIDIKSA